MYDLSDFSSWSELQSALQDYLVNKPCIIVATADWCGPCKQLKSKLVDRAHMPDTDFDAAVWFTLNIEKNGSDLIGELGIKTIPHVCFVGHDGNVVTIKGDHLAKIRQCLAEY